MKKFNKKHVGLIKRLFRKIQPFLKKYGIEDKAIIDAIEKSFEEVKREGCRINPWLLALVFCKIFEDKCFLLIDRRTPAGNTVSFDVFIEAHAIWRAAQRAAAKRGIDELDAAQAMIRIVYTVADRLAQNTAAPIRDIDKYLFTGYINELKRIARKTGILRHKTDKLRSTSDDGAFIEALENAILCGELFGRLSPKLETAAALRYQWGYSCAEAAEKLGSSNSAARQALSRGFREMFEFYMRELRALGYEDMIQNRKKRS